MSRLSWGLRIVVAVILLQTLFFKFTGAEESIYIFTTVGAEPWGRYGSGVMELIAAVLLLIPGTVAIGALLAAGVGVGAVFSHLTVLGIDVQGRRRPAVRPRLRGAGRQRRRAGDPPPRAAARRAVAVNGTACGMTPCTARRIMLP